MGEATGAPSRPTNAISAFGQTVGFAQPDCRHASPWDRDRHRPGRPPDRRLRGPDRCDGAARRRRQRWARAVHRRGRHHGRPTPGQRLSGAQAEVEAKACARPDAEGESVAYFCAEFGVHRSLPDLLGRARRAGRRHPEGGVGPRAADGRASASCTTRATSTSASTRRLAARVLGRHRPRAAPGGPGHRRRRRAARRHGPDRGAARSRQIWRVQVGRVPLLPAGRRAAENTRVDRWITARLYVGDPTRASRSTCCSASAACARSRALGHRARRRAPQRGARARSPRSSSRARGGALDAGSRHALSKTIFTTHTPVPAGNDTYPADLVARRSRAWPSWASTPTRSSGLGRTDRRRDEPFGVTPVRAAREPRRQRREPPARRGRARDVARPVPDARRRDVPISHVTNGVHVPTWMAAPMRALLDRHLGEGWVERATTRRPGRRVDGIPDEELWAVALEQRARLVEYVRERSAPTGSAATSRATRRGRGRAFDPERLTSASPGAWRRTSGCTCCSATPSARSRCSEATARPARDRRQGASARRRGQAPRPAAFDLKWAPGRRPRRFLEDYDLAIAARLVPGCDVWVNLPRPPLEASGTSGMKQRSTAGSTSGARRLVGRGLRRQQRLGASGDEDATTARRTTATPTSSTGCSSTRSCPSSTSATARPAARVAAARPRVHEDVRAAVLGGPDGPGLRQAVLQRRRAPVARDAAPARQSRCATS